MRILVLGASGLLGSYLVPALRMASHDVSTQSRKGEADCVFDPGEVGAVSRFARSLKTDAIINLIAETNVDACEKDPPLAYAANSRSAEEAAKAAKENECRLVQISTDQLYGTEGPHTEELVFPLNVYALSKYAGELAVQQCANHLILRTNFVGCFGPGEDPRCSFVDWLLRQQREGACFTLFKDVLFTPLHAGHLAEMIVTALSNGLKGTFNLGGKTFWSKYTLAKELYKGLELSSQNAICGRSDDVALFARRPQDMRMDSTAYERASGIELPDGKATIASLIADVRKKYPFHP